jgi:hypothetical protein
MGLSIFEGLLIMCLNGNVICEKNYSKPSIKYYEPGKACYIEGVFYESCPKQTYK